MGIVEHQENLAWAKTLTSDPEEQQRIAERLGLLGFQNGMTRRQVEATLQVAKQIQRLADAQALIAAATEKQAEATLLLARATAGEFDEADPVPEPAKPGQGMGMGG